MAEWHYYSLLGLLPKPLHATSNWPRSRLSTHTMVHIIHQNSPDTDDIIHDPWRDRDNSVAPAAGPQIPQKGTRRLAGPTSIIQQHARSPRKRSCRWIISEPCPLFLSASFLSSPPASCSIYRTERRHSPRIHPTMVPCHACTARLISTVLQDGVA